MAPLTTPALPTPENSPRADKKLPGDDFMKEAPPPPKQVMDRDRFMLLTASQPRPMKVRGQYAICIKRASLKQPFGVTFKASETSDKRLSSIFVSEDIPHLGIKQSDVLVEVNGNMPASVAECCEIITPAMSIAMVLQRVKDPDLAPPKVQTPLLWMTPGEIKDARKGEFKMALHRSSLRQKFGLGFHAVPARGNREESIILVSEDMPHLALRRADCLVSINGQRAKDQAACSKLLAASLQVDLVLRRDAHQMDLAPDLEIINAEEDAFRVGICHGFSCLPTSRERSEDCGFPLCRPRQADVPSESIGA